MVDPVFPAALTKSAPELDIAFLSVVEPELLPQLVGRDVAKELAFTGRVIDGVEATALGMTTRTDPAPLSAALHLAADVAARNPDAVRWAKRLLDSAGRIDLAAQLRAEQAAIAELAGSPNQAEAVHAALEQRQARFIDVVNRGSSR